MNRPTTMYNEITFRSNCHKYKGKWTPEREPLAVTLARAGGMAPAFDFRTTEDPDPNRYADLKAAPYVKGSTYKRRRMVLSKAEDVKGRVPHGLVPYREACDTIGLMPKHLARLVREQKVNGDQHARMVNLSSIEAYMAAR